MDSKAIFSFSQIQIKTPLAAQKCWQAGKSIQASFQGLFYEKIYQPAHTYL